MILQKMPHPKADQKKKHKPASLKWKKDRSLLLAGSTLLHICEDKLCSKGSTKITCFPQPNIGDFYH